MVVGNPEVRELDCRRMARCVNPQPRTAAPRSGAWAVSQDAPKSDQVTDFYLASLAEKYGMKLATLDEYIKHPAVVLVK